MDLEKQILFFFSALGAFNGFILTAYFAFFSKKSVSNYFLGGLLLVISVRITKSIFLFFNKSVFNLFLQIGLSACLLIGVFLYFYIKTSSILEKDTKVKARYWWVHVLFWVAFIFTIGSLYPYSESQYLWSTYFMKIIYLQWLVYILLSAAKLKNEFKKLFSKNEKLNENQIWQVSIFFGVFCIWAAYVFGSYASYIVGALSFSFIFYVLGLFWFLKFSKLKLSKNKIIEPLQDDGNTEKEYSEFQKEEEKIPEPSIKYANKKIDEEEANEFKIKIERIIKEEELFKNPNLKLSEVAEKLNVLPHYLSQFLNDNLNKSFPLFINEYRIEAAKKSLLLHDNYTLEAIGYDCGFNSKSTFFSTFKKITGFTPASYKKKQKNRVSTNFENKS